MQALSLISTKAPYILDMQTGRPSNRPRPPFGERLHQLREEAGLTQAQVAEKLSISHRAYAFWEREPTAIRAEQLSILAGLFSVSADLLIGRQTPKQRGPGPDGKMRLLFATASKLSRRQQQRICDVVEDMLVARKINGHKQAA